MSLTDRTSKAPAGDARELVRAHQAGDPAAFDEMVRLHYAALIHHARRTMHDPKVAEDLVQETFLRAYRALVQFNGDYQLGAWLHRILENVCLTEITRRRREFEGNERWLTTPPPPSLVQPEDHAEQVEAMERVLGAVNKLSPSYREAFVLRDVLELEYADVADRTGISEDNARARVHRARVALRQLVERAGAVGGVMWWPVRRLGRLGSTFSDHLSTAGTYVTPDMVQATSTRASAFSTLATTGVAVAAAATVPFIVGGATTADSSAVPPASSVRLSAPAAPSAAAGSYSSVSSAKVERAGLDATVAAPAATVVAPTSSITVLATSTTTSTTGQTPRPTVRAPSAPAAATASPDPSPPTTMDPDRLATLHSDEVVTNAGSGVTEEPATLSQPKQSDEVGRLNTEMMLPAPGAAACQGRIRGRFSWGTEPAGDQATFDAVFVDGTRQGQATLYRFRGQGTVSGSDESLNGDRGYVGSLLVPDEGGVGTLDVELVAANKVNPPASCAPSGQWQSTSSSTAVR